MDRKEEIVYATLELASVNGLRSITMSQIAEKVARKWIIRMSYILFSICILFFQAYTSRKKRGKFFGQIFFPNLLSSYCHPLREVRKKR